MLPRRVSCGRESNRTLLNAADVKRSSEKAFMSARGVPLRVRDQVVVAPSGPVTAEAIKLVFGVSGWARIETPGAELMLQAGTMLAIPAETECAWTPHGHARTVTVYLRPEYVASELRWLSRTHPIVHLLDRTVTGAPRVEQLQLPQNAMKHLMPQLIRMAHLDAVGHEEFALLSAAAHVAALVGRFSGAAITAPSKEGLEVVQPSREVAAAAALIHQQPEQAWTVEKLAAQAALSRSQLTRTFRAQIGVSPATYLRQVRADRMAELLASRRLSVAESSRMAGWDNPVVASRAFKRRYGVNPQTFAKLAGRTRT